MVRATERANGIFKDCCPDTMYSVYVKEKRTIGQRRADAAKRETEPLQKKFPKGSLPPAPFTLKPEEKATADKTLGLVKVPIGFGIIPATLFTRICGGVKCHPWLQIQWLVTMLDSVGFMGPLRQGSSTAPVYQYLSKGRFAAVDRPATADRLIKQFLGPCNLTAVRVLHYATVWSNRYGDTTIENSTMRENASVVSLDEKVCRIQNFVSADVDGVKHELVFLECYGIPHHYVHI